MSGVLDVMVRATAILIAGLAVWLLLRRSSAAGRCTWLRLVSMGLVVLPWLVFFGPSIPVTLPWLSEPAPIVLDASLAPVGELAGAPAPQGVPGLVLWLAASVVALLPAIAGSVVMSRRWRAGRALNSDQLGDVNRVLAEAGVRKTFPVRIGPVSSPLVWGVLAPRMMLPRGFFDWPEAHRRAALLHEAAHLCRGDSRWLAVSNLVRALYVAHPLAWWLAHTLRAETELAADERAMASGMEATDYASSLVEIARTLQNQPVPRPSLAFVQPSGLDTRVLRALGPSRRALALPGALGLGFLAGACVLVTATVRPTSPDPEVVLVPSIVASTPEGPRVAVTVNPSPEVPSQPAGRRAGVGSEAPRQKPHFARSTKGTRRTEGSDRKATLAMPEVHVRVAASERASKVPQTMEVLVQGAVEAKTPVGERYVRVSSEPRLLEEVERAIAQANRELAMSMHFMHESLARATATRAFRAAEDVKALSLLVIRRRMAEQALHGSSEAVWEFRADLAKGDDSALRKQRLELERLFLERGKASPVRVVGVVNRVGAPAPAESPTAVPPK